jgi:hypothetical protein
MSPMGRGLSHWWRRLVTGGLMGWKGFEGTPSLFVMPGLDPGIHVFATNGKKTWMAGTSPAMTADGRVIPPAWRSRAELAADLRRYQPW